MLADAGWPHQVFSWEPPGIANRVLVASRFPLESDGVELPNFDQQFRANMAAVLLPTIGLRVLGVRVPAYESKDRHQLRESWRWLENAARIWSETATVILGDLNVGPTPSGRRDGHFERILSTGWTRAQPTDRYSYSGHGDRRSEIDHILVTSRCAVREARYVTKTDEFVLAGADGALSDHAQNRTSARRARSRR